MAKKIATIPFTGTPEQEQELRATIDALREDPGCLMPIMQKAQEIYGDAIEYTNLFDRQYFPNGMWGIMGEAITTVVMNPTDDGIAEAVQNLKTNYLDKREADGN